MDRNGRCEKPEMSLPAGFVTAQRFPPAGRNPVSAAFTKPQSSVHVSRGWPASVILKRRMRHAITDRSAGFSAYSENWLDEMNADGGIMRGKRGLIMGVANSRSIAFGIAKAVSEAGAEVALTYQGDALKKRVEPIAEQLGGMIAGHCDVTDDASMDAVFSDLEKTWGKIDFMVHAIAFSDKDQLTGRYIETTEENFNRTMNISCYSLTALARRAERLMPDGGSILTLTYYGAEKVMPHYNVMGVAKAALEASVRYLAVDLGKSGIRVNAISAGPIKTLAASGIGDFRYILKWNEYNAPLKKTVSIDEVGQSALYLLSDMSAGVSGEVHHVDSGYHVVGMKAVDAPDISVVKDE
jgi:enoyl-[acyl-carrier protein] reductase I